MKSNKYIETQIVSLSKEVEAGIQVEELCRKHGFSQSAIYKWIVNYSGMVVSALKQLKKLQEESQHLERMYADLSLEYQALKDTVQKTL